MELQARQDALFGDPAHGGYFSVTEGRAEHPPAHEGRLRWRGAIAELRFRAAICCGWPDPRPARMARARRSALWRPLRPDDAKPRLSVPQMLCALDGVARDKPRQIVIAGARAAAETRALTPRSACPFPAQPNAAAGRRAAGQKWLAERLEFLGPSDPWTAKPPPTSARTSSASCQ